MLAFVCPDRRVRQVEENRIAKRIVGAEAVAGNQVQSFAYPVRRAEIRPAALRHRNHPQIRDLELQDVMREIDIWNLLVQMAQCP